MQKLRFVLVFIAAAIALPAQAEIFGLANGRSANTDMQPDMSVELGATLGDFQTLGLRLNYKVSPDLVVYGDVGQTDVGLSDGFAFGIGAYYYLRNTEVLENTDFAIKASYHSADLSFSSLGVSGDYTGNVLSIEAIISGDQLGETNFGWYGNVGFHNVDFGYADNSEIGFGAGVTSDISFGQFYAGLDWIDEIGFAAGVRYFLN